METRDLLIEIGTEELPPRSLSQLSAGLETNIGLELDAVGLVFAGIRGLATPRRLAVLVNGLAANQPEQQNERRGPAVSAAFDKQGNPTRAALGFARSCGVEVTALETMETEKGAWLVHRQTRPGESAGALIESIVTRALANLPVDRRMRWGASRVEFVRPVHWIVLLYGDEVLPASIMGQAADRITRGHRFMGELRELRHANEYVEALREQYVVADKIERSDVIRQQLLAQAKELGGEVIVDEALLDEVTALVEWPVTLAGRFEDVFLDLPEEVLISVMTEHQRYFHLRDANGKLMPRFLTVANIESKEPAAVVSGNERVIKPRLADAAFFYDVDIKTTLAEKLDRLGNVVFQSMLGSYLSKAERIERLASEIGRLIGADETQAARAGLLCKSDLVLDMVGEFPGLQGVIGGYYAAVNGEPGEVARAIGEHYLPIQSGGALPSTTVGCCVALADKLDTLVGLFAIGQPPSGSRDPFALRRQALGVIRVCVEKSLDLNLPECLVLAAEGYAGKLDIGVEPVADVAQYIINRFANWSQEQGIAQDTFSAVRQSDKGIANLMEAWHRLGAMEAFREHERAENLIAANKRVANILRDIDTRALPHADPGAFDDDAEGVLYKSLQQARNRMAAAGDYEQQFLALADLQPDIDRYFDDVMVMTDNERLRQNRLATLAEMRTLFLSLADFSVLQPRADGHR